MTNSNSILADAVLVAIDIAKLRNEVLIEAPTHKRRRRLSVLNNRVEGIVISGWRPFGNMISGDV